jgi:hypothetical protein
MPTGSQTRVNASTVLPNLFLELDTGDSAEGHVTDRSSTSRDLGRWPRFTASISPNYVSSVVQDHTSLTAFIGHKWNLPAMTYRDPNADPMTDYFDFRRPAFAEPPRLTAAPSLEPGLERRRAHGLSPPLPSASPTAESEVGRLLAAHFRR